MKRLFSWFVMNGILVSSCIYGLFYHVKWAENIFLFLAWLCVVAAIANYSVEKSRLECRAKGRPVPLWLDTLVDVVIVLALASVGRFVLAAFFVFHISCNYQTYNGKD